MITTKIEAVIKKYNMLSKGDTVAVAVSGGADSMLLLSWLNDNRQKYGIEVIAANVEHGIRGEDSIADSEFVKKYCQAHEIRLYSISIDAPKEAKAQKMGVEEYSRIKRYEFFDTLNADKIATAHSLSDNVETVLFRLSRGTSAKGLSGIPPVRGKIIRPLLECTSAEIREYCANNDIPFVIDKTNFDNDYSRNYIRNIIVPEFKKLNPDFESAVMRFAASACEDNAALESEAAELKLPLEIERLKAASPAVAKRAIVRLAEGEGITLDEKHINEVYRLVFKTGRTQLKGKIFAVSDYKYLAVKELDFESYVPYFKSDFKIVSSNEFIKNKELIKKEFDFYCDCDKIVGNLTVRSRLPHDKLTLAYRNCSKTVKKLMNELKIPEDKRNAVPVICDGEGVIGLYGYAYSSRILPDGNTKRYYLLKVTLEDNT